MPWVTARRYAEMTKRSIRRVRELGHDGALKRKEAPAGSNELWVYWLEEEEAPETPVEDARTDEEVARSDDEEAAGIIADHVRLGEKLGGGGETYYDSSLDQYCIPPAGRGRKIRQIDGWLARKILEYHKERVGWVEKIEFEAPPRPPRIRFLGDRGRDRTVLMSPTDLHFAMRATELETGGSWDMDICRETLMRATDRALDDVLSFGQPREFVVMAGSDYFHFNDASYQTERGTKMDPDGTFVEMMHRGAQLFLDYVNTLRQFAPVRVLLLAGNHDRTVAQATFWGIQQAYKDADDVDVIVDYRARQYMKIGPCVVGLTHGDGPKPDKLPSLLKLEARELFGQTTQALVLHGHYHHFSQREVAGVHVISLSSLSKSDRWHVNSGYRGARQRINALVIDHEFGLVATLHASGEETGQAP